MNTIQHQQNQYRQQQIKRNHFSREEDERLRLLVEKYGENEWSLVCSEMPNRTIRQCRERWQHHLKETVLKSKWSSEEDRLLFVKYQEIGPKWKYMEKYFPGRTSINIRNRFNCLRRFNILYFANNYQQPQISPQNQVHVPITVPVQIPVHIQSVQPVQQTQTFITEGTFQPNSSNQNDLKEEKYSVEEDSFSEFSYPCDEVIFDTNFDLDFLYNCF